ncbi:BSP-domain-containing protein [Durotheca rogersii]|uniref:BSP-domain-containing protein n=1 Tax=Durotheca rogersii TaxID=419775 RepID=UPI00221EB207|nr:BSP-domain-containing protein [Durotheca rogersii]KAI5865075.1 BSP-domain-containing protein [Durotheca rogersii]
MSNRGEHDGLLAGAANLSISLALSAADSDTREERVPRLPMPLAPQTTAVPAPGTSRRAGGPQDRPPLPRPSSPPLPAAPLVLPRLRLHVEDIAHDGARVFLSSVNAVSLLRDSLGAVHTHLYTGAPFSSPSCSASSSAAAKRPHVPPTLSVTLLLRAIDGVAYTTGTDLDPLHHKEIHLSLRYVALASHAARVADEIRGVLTHELVHCYQWNGRGLAPGGLIEGVADWVRLRADLVPPHWHPTDIPSSWDAGYQHTAYFLDYLERRFGDGTVRRLNEKLRTDKYDEEAFWTELLGAPVAQLFEDYKETLEVDDKKPGQD